MVTRGTLRVDYGEPASEPYKGRAFSEPLKTPKGDGFAWARGYGGCDVGSGCRTVLTKRGPEFRGPAITQRSLTGLRLSSSCGYSGKVRVFSALPGQTLRVFVNAHVVATFPPAPAFEERDLDFRMEPADLHDHRFQLFAVDYGIRRDDWGVGLAMMSLTITPDAACPPDAAD
jgi:hypothetical protein